MSSVSQLCDKNMTKMGDGCQNIDLNRGSWYMLLGERFNGLSDAVTKGGDQPAVRSDKC